MCAVHPVRGWLHLNVVGLRARGAFVASLLAMPVSAHAALKQWNNPGGGSVTTPGNWNPNGVPGSGDDLDFSLVGSYPVTFASPVTSSNSVILHRGHVTATLNNTHTSTALFRIGDTLEFCTLTITTGTMQSSITAILGNGPDGVGTMNVNDADALFQTNSATSDINVGHAGGGVLNLTNGGRVVSSDDILLGNLVSTAGTVTVNGFNAGAAQASRMRTTAANGDILVGFSGTGTLHVLAGGNVTSSDDLFVASNASSNGTINVGGFGLTNSTLAVADALDVARNETAAFAGIGTLNVNADGLVTVGGAMRVDDPDGGTGKVNINGGTLNVTSSITSLGEIKLAGGSIAASQLMLSGGTLGGVGTVNAPVDASAATVTVKPGNSAGTLNLSSTYTQNGPAATGGTLEMEIGGSKTSQFDRLVIGGAATLGGTLRVLLINGYVPNNGDNFTILTASSVNGTFDAIELPPPSNNWQVTYTPTSVVVDVVGTFCQADISPPGAGGGDGVVNIDDLLLVVNNWGDTGPPGTVDGDANTNGVVNIDDLLMIVHAWGGCP